MKIIAHITGMHSSKYGSLENYFLHLIVRCNTSGYRTLMQYETIPASREYLNELKKLGAEIIIFTTNGNPLKMLINYATFIFKTKPEIVHAHFVNRYTRLIIPVIARIAGSKRILCTVHNNPPYTKRNIARFTYNLYSSILPVSRSVELSLLKGGARSSIISALYLGLFGERNRSMDYRRRFREKFGIPQDSIVLICIAFDAPFKGVDILLEAFRIIYDKYPNVFLLLVGIDPQKSHLPKVAEEMSISDRIRWAGIIDEGWKTLSAADIYVQPSRAEEGLPLAIMEAMNMRIPIVCTNISGNIEAVIDEKNGLICNPTKRDLAATIEKMILRPSAWVEMGKFSYERFRELFDGEKSIKSLVEEYYGLQ